MPEVLDPEHDGHDGDEEAEEGLQLPQPVLVQEEEGEGVHDGEQHARPDGDLLVRQDVEGYSCTWGLVTRIRSPDYVTRIRSPDHVTRIRSPDHVTRISSPDHVTRIRSPDHRSPSDPTYNFLHVTPNNSDLHH